MRSRQITLIAGVLLTASICCGCGMNLDSILGASASEIQPMEQYREEAAKEITSDNAEAELARLEQEVEADAAAGQ